jgi:hypothetical protein
MFKIPALTAPICGGKTRRPRLLRLPRRRTLAGQCFGTQVGRQHPAPADEGVRARPLAEGELQFLQPFADVDDVPHSS